MSDFKRVHAIEGAARAGVVCRVLTNEENAAVRSNLASRWHVHRIDVLWGSHGSPTSSVGTKHPAKWFGRYQGEGPVFLLFPSSPAIVEFPTWNDLSRCIVEIPGLDFAVMSEDGADMAVFDSEGGLWLRGGLESLLP